MAALPWDASIDYGAAGEAVDYLVLKTSPDPLPGQPGSGASTAEVEAMLQEITASVAPETLILGLSTGGIHWPRSGLPRSLLAPGSSGISRPRGCQGQMGYRV